MQDEALLEGAVDSILEHEVAQDARGRLGHRVAVSSDGPDVFLYAATEEAAREAERVVRDLLAQRKLSADYRLDRWHPIEQEWEDASVPMPQTDQQRQAEHQRLVEEETRESVEAGQAGWEVRVAMPSRHQAIELATRLQGEGRRVVRRWKYLVLGANNEDDANDLAELVRHEAPATATVDSGSVPFVGFGVTEVGGVPVLPAD